MKYIYAFLVFLAFDIPSAIAVPVAASSDVVEQQEQQIPNLKRQAAHGDIKAQRYLGKWYYNPEPEITSDKADWMHGDNKQAFKYFMQAAEAGDAEAQTYVGWLYKHGWGVKQDYTAALKWYHMAEAQGYTMVLDPIGTMYRDGYGVPQDYSLAAEYFSKAFQQYFGSSNELLACLYFTGGPNLRQDYEQAAFWEGIGGNPTWREFHSGNDLNGGEDNCNRYKYYWEKHLTLQQFAKVKEQVQGYKMPSPPKGAVPNKPCPAPCAIP